MLKLTAVWCGSHPEVYRLSGRTPDCLKVSLTAPKAAPQILTSLPILKPVCSASNTPNSLQNSNTVVLTTQGLRQLRMGSNADWSKATRLRLITKEMLPHSMITRSPQTLWETKTSKAVI